MSGGGAPVAGSGHLSRELLDDFFLGRVTALELVERTARHLDATCPGCHEGLAPAGGRFRRAFREAARRLRARAPELAAERAAVGRRVAELARHEGIARLLAVAGDRAFHTAAFVEHQLGIGWAAVEGGALGAAREALELGHAAAIRLDADRYGRIAAARLETEARLLRARLGLALGRREEAALALEAAGRRLPACAGGDLEAGLLLGRASLSLRDGDRAAARALLEAAAGLAAAGRAGRWQTSIETALAALDRRDGRPGRAAERLRRLLREEPEPPCDPPGWRAARELVLALVASGQAPEAAAFVTRWQGDDERALGAGQAELAHARGLVLGAAGRGLAARRALWRAWVFYWALGRGLDAALAALDLARLTGPERAGGEPLAGREALLRELEGLVGQEDVPPEGLVALARFARALARDKLDGRELEAVEERLLRLRPAWAPAGHGPA